MQSVVDTLKASGVADKDVQTTDLSMNPEYAASKGQPPVLTGYRVSHSVSVTVEDFAKASDIVTAALNAGGSGVRPRRAPAPGRRPGRLARAGPHRRASSRPAPRPRSTPPTRAASSARSCRISEVTDQPYYRRHGSPTAPPTAARASAVPDPGRAAGPDRERRGGLRAEVALGRPLRCSAGRSAVATAARTPSSAPRSSSGSHSSPSRCLPASTDGARAASWNAIRGTPVPSRSAIAAPTSRAPSRSRPMSNRTHAKSSQLVSTASGMSSARISGSSVGELVVRLVVAAQVAQRAGPVVADAR